MGINLLNTCVSKKLNILLLASVLFLTHTLLIIIGFAIDNDFLALLATSVFIPAYLFENYTGAGIITIASSSGWGWPSLSIFGYFFSALVWFYIYIVIAKIAFVAKRFLSIWRNKHG